MLTHLSITNYAIIEALEIDFDKGYTVITGETGAGKSIMLGALGLILGQRADAGVLYDTSKKCIVEGEFAMDARTYADFFEANDLDFEQPTTLRREIAANGKSRAFINDTPVTLQQLKALTERLVDIHSQHETLQIKNGEYQLNVLDAFAGTQALLQEYQQAYQQYRSALDELNRLKSLSSRASADLDYIRFQYEEIEALQLKPDEKETIEEQLDLAKNSEEIKRVLNAAEQALQDADHNVLAVLKSLVDSFSRIRSYAKEYEQIYERLNSSLIELDDLTREVVAGNTDFDFDADQLDYLNERLSKIYSIEQKHQVKSTAAILELLKNLEAQLSDYASFDDKIERAATNVSERFSVVESIGKELSGKRKQVTGALEQTILGNLAQLGMPDASFRVDCHMLSEPGSNGWDVVEFRFSANKGYPLEPLSKVASGGELSRFMLTIKSILAKNKSLATVLFDEIDTGVSGEIADKMADIMKAMSNDSQIITITHLPQVAAKGQSHFKIFKENRGERTLTLVRKLNKEERVEELAKMLSGKKMTDEAKKNAEALLSVDKPT
ncbi:MAG: DNA repair protein RecN [Flavobacteriales bacterium]|nr:DNA repair protein RecN [Flavobacteriales bacterium]